MRYIYLSVFRSLTTFCLLLTIAAGFYYFNPVPVADSWTTLDSYYRVSGSKTWQRLIFELWDTHNEHRIALTRLLLWLDYACFSGAAILPIAVHYALLAGIVCVLDRYLKAVLMQHYHSFGAVVLRLLVCSGIFSLLQIDNLTSPFQSQFFLAYLLPLAAFYFLCQVATDTERRRFYFVMACLSGVLALGSMGNGILTLPLLCLMALLLRLQRTYLSVLLVLTLLTLTAHYATYHPAPNAHSLLKELQTETFDVLHYLLLYLGAPIYLLTGQSTVVIGELAGLLLIVSSAYAAMRLNLRAKNATITLALLIFLVYIGGTALGVTGARAFLGLDTAYTSRYLTSTLIAWSVLLVIYAPYWVDKFNRGLPSMLIGALVLQGLLVIQQVKQFALPTEPLFDYKLAALALELGIDDPQQISVLYPEPQTVRAIATQAIEQDLSIFGHPLIRNAKEQFLQHESGSSTHTCLGFIAAYKPIVDPRFVRISGKLQDPASQQLPKIIHALDSQGSIVGYAIADRMRGEVKDGKFARAA